MGIPLYFLRRPSWQRFIAGFILGMIVGWTFFIALNGLAQDRQIDIINDQQARINSLEKDKDIFQEDMKKENKELQKKLTVQELQIEFSERANAQLSKTTLSKLEEEVRGKLSSIMTQNIESVAANKELINLIENEPYEIDKETYRVTIQSLVIYSTVEIVLKVKEIS